MIGEKTKVKHTCNACGKKNHEWHEVYYGDRATLKKIDKTFISWCEKVNSYILSK